MTVISFNHYSNIIQDMEKWAKSMNAQKEAVKDGMKKINMANLLGKKESATADAGFAILEKVVSIVFFKQIIFFFFMKWSFDKYFLCISYVLVREMLIFFFFSEKCNTRRQEVNATPTIGMYVRFESKHKFLWHMHDFFRST